MNSKKVDILLVDDREDGLIALEAVLGGRGYNLVKASSGREALDLLPTSDFAVVLLDVQMPVLDGFQTAELMRQEEWGRHVPIIFITAINKDDAYIQRGYDAGAVDYLFKPFDPHVLRSKVAVFVDLHLKTRQIQSQAILLEKVRRREEMHDRVQAEVESLRRYRTLADAVPHLIWKASKQGLLMYRNKGWIEYTGAGSVDDSKLGWMSVFSSADAEPLFALWNDSNPPQDGLAVEMRIRNRAGEYRWHWVRVVPEHDQQGKLVGWIGTCTDIHDRKLAEQGLIAARELAETASRAKTHFVANMSHEIRTPLNAILGFSELLVDPQMTMAQKLESLATIRRNGQNLLNIIDEVLDISKVESGKLLVERAPTDLGDLLMELRTSIGLRAIEKGLKFSFEVGGPFPRSVVTDGGRLRQILLNLLGNGIKFTDRGSVRMMIGWVPTGEGEGKLQFEITDTGIGISKANMEHLFMPFVQADTSTTRRFGGTGLGLAISRRLARALGGDIRVIRTEEGRGSTFLLDLPVQTKDSALISALVENPSGRAREISKGSAGELSGLHILLVEDIADNQMLVTRFLRAAGAQVDLAGDGVEAVEKALAKSYSVVLMDIQMPKKDGYEATIELRRGGYRGPILAMTAHAFREERERCLRAGCDGHITKPIDRKVLLESVKLHARTGAINESRTGGPG